MRGRASWMIVVAGLCACSRFSGPKDTYDPLTCYTESKNGRLLLSFNQPRGAPMTDGPVAMPGIQLLGSATYEPADMGAMAIHFAVPRQGVLVPDNDQLDGFTNLTMHALVRFEGFPGKYSTIAKKDGSYLLQTCNTCDPRTLSMAVWNSTGLHQYDAPFSPKTNTWYRLAGLYRRPGDSNLIKLYVDKALLGESEPFSGDAAVAKSSSPLLLGKHPDPDNNSEDLRGFIDQFDLCGD